MVVNSRQQSFTVAFVHYAPEGAVLSMPIAVLAATLKRVFPNICIQAVTINKSLPSEQHSIDWFSQQIKELNPDLVAISCMMPHWSALKEYLSAVKISAPQAKTLIGSYQAVLSPEETIVHTDVDFICVGDGEIPITQLVERLLQQSDKPIPGLWEKTANGQVLRSAAVMSNDLNAFPFPDYSVFEKNGSLIELGLSIFGPRGKFILPVMTGRGCPYKCTYCSNTALLDVYKGQGSYIRKYDIHPLIDELERLRDHYNVDYFEFWDELFMVDVKYALAFFKEYKQRIHRPFSINARVERMDEEFCKVAAEAGCHNIWFGIESGSEQYRINRLGRKMTNDLIIAAAQNAKKFGINRLTFNIVGMPYETLENAQETLRLNEIIQPEFFFFFTYMPLEGTPLYNVAKRGSLLINKDFISSDYLENQRQGGYRLNLREHQGGMSHQEFHEVCTRMQVFQASNNRLDI